MNEMRLRRLYIEKYDWEVTVFYAVTCYHVDRIMQAMLPLDPSEDILQRIHSNLTKCSMDTGFTYSSKNLCSTVMVIGLHSSPAQFLNSLEHEMRHLVDDIAGHFELDMGGEEVAYLTGDINEQIIRDVQHFICQCSCHTGRQRQSCGCEH